MTLFFVFPNNSFGIFLSNVIKYIFSCIANCNKYMSVICLDEISNFNLVDSMVEKEKLSGMNWEFVFDLKSKRNVRISLNEDGLFG